MGTGEGPHSGPRPRSRVARGWAGEGHRREYPCVWEPLWRCSWQARGWRPKSQVPSLCSLSPSEQVKKAEGSGRGWQTGPPGLTSHLSWSPPHSQMGVDLTPVLPQSWKVPPRPLNQKGDPRAAAKWQLPPTHQGCRLQGLLSFLPGSLALTMALTMEGDRGAPAHRGSTGSSSLAMYQVQR